MNIQGFKTKDGSIHKYDYSALENIPDGKIIASVKKTVTMESDMVTEKSTTITFTYTDGTTTEFTVSNGSGTAIHLFDNVSYSNTTYGYPLEAVTVADGQHIKKGDLLLTAEGKIYSVTSVSTKGVKVELYTTIEGTQNSGGNADHVGVEPAEDDIPKIFFGGALQQTKDEKVVPFRYISKTDDFSGYAEIKAQGNSSMSYPKKNQTVKLFADEACETKMKVDFKGWGKQNKHVYKANWIDLSHARNVVSARLWADVVKSRADYESLPELFRTTPNQGAVDGFPVKVYADGVYQGRYTLNIPKDKWTFNMDDELDNHCVLCGENDVSGWFRAEANINGSDWTDEIHDVVPASIKTRWNDVISFVMNSTDDDFRSNLGQYFYVDSLIDYYLFGLVSCGLDAFAKNQIYATYDGQRWIASMYDMDSTWGLWWTGSQFVPVDSWEQGSMAQEGAGNLLYIRLEKLFYSELQTRWAELKNGALSIENIINRFERFTDIAPTELVKEDFASTTGGGKFTGIPSQTTNNIQQIRAFALARQVWTDEYVANLTASEPEEPDEPETPDTGIPCTGITLDKSELTFTGEGTQTITATVSPADTTDTVVWVSSAPAVASITVEGNVCTVQSVGNGDAVITVTCGDYSASCSVSVSGMAAALLYSLPEATEFDGVDDYIDTGIKLFDTPKDFTIVMSADLSKCTSNNYPVFHCINEVAPWPGLSLQCINVCSWVIAGNTTNHGGAGGEFVKSIPNSSNVAVAIVVKQGVVTGAKLAVCGEIITPELLTPRDYVAITQNIILGAYQDVSGNKGRFFTGTIYSFNVYSSAFSDAEMEAHLSDLFNGWEATIVRENYSPNGSTFVDTFEDVNSLNDCFVEAEINLENCTDTNENILSIGQNIETYGVGPAIHLHYTASSSTLKMMVDPSEDSGEYSEGSIVLSDKLLHFFIGTSAMIINDTLIGIADMIHYATNYYKNLASAMQNTTDLTIGSVEGNVRSKATYNYIKVWRKAGTGTS